MLDYVLGNLIIHYSKTRILHPRQGFGDLFEVITEEHLLTNSTKLVYLLVGRAEVQSPPGSVIEALETLLENVSKEQPRVMTVLGAVLISPWDSITTRANIVEINQRMAKLAERDHHWLYFNSNHSVSLAGEPQKRFFDRDGKLNKPGCRFLAQGLVATSKAARMLQNYNDLPPKHG